MLPVAQCRSNQKQHRPGGIRNRLLAERAAGLATFPGARPIPFCSEYSPSRAGRGAHLSQVSLYCYSFSRICTIYHFIVVVYRRETVVNIRRFRLLFWQALEDLLGDTLTEPPSREHVDTSSDFPPVRHAPGELNTK